MVVLKGRKIPMRQCIGCRESKAQKELVRIVKGEDKDDHSITVCVDRTGRINGRGAYLCNSLECFNRARKNHALNRVFKIDVADEIYNELERQLSE